MVNRYITELINYGTGKGLIEEEDRIYATNKVLEIMQEEEYEEEEITEQRPLHLILRDLTDEAVKRKLTGDTTAARDLFDTKIMGAITPPPSKVIREFKKREDPKDATNWYYQFSKDTNYIRTDRIAKDVKWVSKTPYGDIDITINLSKPEKDPRDIAAAGKKKSTSYPKCLLCKENEGYAGTISHPARQNHRVIPISLNGEEYFLQYSPYVYYNEHCIIFNKEHVPMVINRDTFR